MQHKYEETIKNHLKDLEMKDYTYLHEKNNLDAVNQKNLAKEIERSSRLQEKIASITLAYENNMEQTSSEYDKTIRALQQDAEKKEKKLKATITSLQEESRDAEKMFREILDQQEEEYEMELMQAKAAAEDHVHQEQVKNHKMRGILTTINSRRDQLSRQNSDLKSKYNTYEQSYKNELQKTTQLEVSNKRNKHIHIHSHQKQFL